MQIRGNYSVSNMTYLINKVGYFDDFIAFCDTQNRYEILVGKFDDEDNSFSGTRFSLTRSGTTSQTYTVSSSQINETISFPSDDHLLYSNIGYGQYYARDYSQPLLMCLIIFVGFYICKTAIGGALSWFARKR